MFRTDEFSPDGHHELSAEQDATCHALSGSCPNTRSPEDDRDHAEKSIERLKKELERAQRRSKDAADVILAFKKEFNEAEERRLVLEMKLLKARERQASFEAKPSDPHAAMACLAEEKKRLQRELAKAREEIENKNTLLAIQEQLQASLATNADVLQCSLEQLDKRLNTLDTDQLMTPTHKDTCNGDLV